MNKDLKDKYGRNLTTFYQNKIKGKQRNDHYE